MDPPVGLLDVTSSKSSLIFLLIVCTFSNMMQMEKKIAIKQTHLSIKCSSVDSTIALL